VVALTVVVSCANSEPVDAPSDAAGASDVQESATECVDDDCTPDTSTVGPAPMPDESTTGVPQDGRLRRLPDDDYFTVESDGEVFDGVEINGCIVILADDVVVRNSLIRCAGPNPAIWQREGEGGVFERNTIEGSEFPSAGIAGSHMEARGNRITGTVDGIKIGPDSVVEGNWISDLAQGEIDGEQTHNDGIQSQGGSQVLIVGNRIEGPKAWWANGGAFLKQEADSPPIHDAVIASNWFSGFGYTVRCMFEATCTIVNNVFVEDSMEWGPFRLEEGATGTIACNEWSDGTEIEDQDTAECPYVLDAGGSG
jgi:hypothetical protein